MVGLLTTLPGWPLRQLLLQPRQGQVELTLLLDQQPTDEMTGDVADIVTDSQLQPADSVPDWDALFNPQSASQVATIDTKSVLKGVSWPSIEYLGHRSTNRCPVD